MKGHPKFKYNEKVQFTLEGKTWVGDVYIIDEYGTWDDDSDVSYDIMVHNWGPKNEDCLFKHITERLVSKV